MYVFCEFLRNSFEQQVYAYFRQIRSDLFKISVRQDSGCLVYDAHGTTPPEGQRCFIALAVCWVPVY